MRGSSRNRRAHAGARAFGPASLALLAAMLLAACTSSGAPGRPPSPPASSPRASASGTANPSPSPTQIRTPAPTPTPALDPLAGMTLQQQVGQLFMVGTPATYASPTTLNDIAALGVGNVLLSGRSHAGSAATAAVVAQFTAAATPAATAGLPLFVATDQEGGEVQVLQGPGFDEIPTAVQQGALAPAVLQQDAADWGSELKSAGVNMNLAPVSDLISSPQAAANNPPIGGFQRQYGYDPATIESHVDAFRAGMSSAGVVPVIKHFPGLGNVTLNTDTSSGVTDAVTDAQSPSVGVFGAEIDGGARVVMVSTAIYSRLDPSEPAAFSSPIVTGLLRHQLGFTGVVITDDLSAAKQVSGYAPADRAILSIQAGVDIVLVSASPELAAPMIQAVVAKAQADPMFLQAVQSAARRVIALKRAELG